MHYCDFSPHPDMYDMDTQISLAKHREILTDKIFEYGEKLAKDFTSPVTRVGNVNNVIYVVTSTDGITTGWRIEVKCVNANRLLVKVFTQYDEYPKLMISFNGNYENIIACVFIVAR